MNLGRILRDGKPVAVRVQGDSVEPLALADAGLGCLDELLSHADLPSWPSRYRRPGQRFL